MSGAVFSRMLVGADRSETALSGCNRQNHLSESRKVSAVRGIPNDRARMDAWTALVGTADANRPAQAVRRGVPAKRHSFPQWFGRFAGQKGPFCYP